jgi:hypothetical protein
MSNNAWFLLPLVAVTLVGCASAVDTKSAAEDDATYEEVEYTTGSNIPSKRLTSRAQKAAEAEKGKETLRQMQDSQVRMATPSSKGM